MPRVPTQTKPEALARQQAVEKDIKDHLNSRRIRKDEARELANEGLRLTEHLEVSAQIQYSRMAVERLLGHLEDETRVEEVLVESGVADVGETAKGGRVYTHNEGASVEDDYVADVLLLREAAAADCTNETMSVADYAAEPPSPPAELEDDEGFDWGRLGLEKNTHKSMTSKGAAEFLTVKVPPTSEGGADLSELICQEIRVSTRKVHHSMFMAKQLMISSPQWWASRLVARRINTFLLRANYHARKVKTWSDRLRSRTFLNSTSVNRAALDVAADMALVTKNQAELLKKHEDAEAEKKWIEHEIADLKARLNRLGVDKLEAEKKLTSVAHCKDSGVAETVLLLRQLQPVRRLQPMCQVIRQWLVVQDTFQGGKGGDQKQR